MLVGTITRRGSVSALISALIAALIEAVALSEQSIEPGAIRPSNAALMAVSEVTMLQFASSDRQVASGAALRADH